MGQENKGMSERDKGRGGGDRIAFQMYEMHSRCINEICYTQLIYTPKK